MTDDTRALIEEAKRYHSATPDRLRCAFCLGTWPCLTVRLAAALEALDWTWRFEVRGESVTHEPLTIRDAVRLARARAEPDTEEEDTDR